MHFDDEIWLDIAFEGYETDDGEVFPGGNLGYSLYNLHGIIAAAQERAYEDERFREYIESLIEDRIPENGERELEDEEEFISRIIETGIVNDFQDNQEYFARGRDYAFNIKELKIYNPCDCGIITIPLAVIVVGAVLKFGVRGGGGVEIEQLDEKIIKDKEGNENRKVRKVKIHGSVSTEAGVELHARPSSLDGLETGLSATLEKSDEAR